MSDYPLLGNRIEVHERESDSEKDRRKYNVVVDEQLYEIINTGENWNDSSMPGRKIVKYRATADDSITTEHPLRGEGIEVREEEKSGAWQGYSLYVAPDLYVEITKIENRPNDPQSDRKKDIVGRPDPKQGYREDTADTHDPKQGCKEDGTDDPKQGGEEVKPGTDDPPPGWKDAKDGRWVFGYYATDDGFYPADADTHCT